MLERALAAASPASGVGTRGTSNPIEKPVEKPVAKPIERVGNPRLAGRQIYGGGYSALESYLYFSHAALEFLKRKGDKPNIIHVHDWRVPPPQSWRCTRETHDTESSASIPHPPSLPPPGQPSRPGPPACHAAQNAEWNGQSGQNGTDRTQGGALSRAQHRIRRRPALRARLRPAALGATVVAGTPRRSA